MKVVVYCNIWKDGIGDFGHFKDIVNRLLESYGSAIEIIGLVIYDSSAHHRQLLEQELQRYNTQPCFHAQLLDKSTQKEEDAYLLKVKDIKGVIVVSTPFYNPKSIEIKSLPILHFPEHEAASFFQEHCSRESIEFDKLTFSMGLHEVSHGLLLKPSPSVSPESLFASLEDTQYRNFLLETHSSENYSQFLKETLIVPLYVRQRATTFAHQVIKSILVSELAQTYKNIVFHTNFPASQKEALSQLFEGYCFVIRFMTHDGIVTEDRFCTDSKYKTVKIVLNYRLSSNDYESLFWIAQEFAVGRGDKTLELMLSNPNIIPIFEIQHAKTPTFEALDRYIAPHLFEEKAKIDSFRSYMSWLLYTSPNFVYYPPQLKTQLERTPNIGKTSLESFLTYSFKSSWKNVNPYLMKYLNFNIKLDFYLLLFFQNIVIAADNPNRPAAQEISYSQHREGNSSFYQFAYQLLYVPEDKRKSIIEDTPLKLHNGYQFAALLILLPEKERYEFLTSTAIPEYDSKLVEIFMYFLPQDKRWDFYSKHKNQILDTIQDNLYVIKSITARFPEEMQWNFINDLSSRFIAKLAQKNYYKIDDILHCIPVALRLKFILACIYKDSLQLEALSNQEIITILNYLHEEDAICFFYKFSREKILSLCKHNFHGVLYNVDNIDQLSQQMIESNINISELFICINNLDLFLKSIKDQSSRDRFINFILKDKTIISLIKYDSNLAALCNLFSRYVALPQLVTFLKEDTVIHDLKTSIGEKDFLKALIENLPQEYYQEFIDQFGGLETLFERELVEAKTLKRLSDANIIDLIQLLDESKLHNILAKIMMGHYPLIDFYKNCSVDFMNKLIGKLSVELSSFTFSDHSFMVVFSRLPQGCHETLIKTVGPKKIVVDIDDKVHYILENEDVKKAYSIVLKLALEPKKETKTHDVSNIKNLQFFKPEMKSYLSETNEPLEPNLKK